MKGVGLHDAFSVRIPRDVFPSPENVNSWGLIRTKAWLFSRFNLSSEVGLEH